MVASTEDASRGWQYYRASGYSVSLEEINVQLERDGMKPVSDRMYRHYRKLRAYGYVDYIPINRLDVKTLLDPTWDDTVRNRYIPVIEKREMTIEILVDNGRVALHGFTELISPSFVKCIIDDKEQYERAKQSNIIKHLYALTPILVFDDGNIGYAVSVKKITLDEERMIIEAEFASMVPVERIIGKEVLPKTEIVMTYTPSEEYIVFDGVVSKLYWLYQALEVSRCICDELFRESIYREKYVLPSNSISRIAMSSPLSIFVTVAIPTANLILQQFAKARKIWHEGTKVKAETGQILAQTEYQREQTRQLKLKNDTFDSAVKVVDKYVSEIGGDRRQQTALLNEQKYERLRELMKNQLIPAVDKLTDNTTGMVKLSGGEIDDAKRIS